MNRRVAAANSVFINVPFDTVYERLFVALVAALCMLGLRPRCVLEVDSSSNRLERLLAVIQSCRVSIHDLSRVHGYPPRFNMPFELGLAVAVKYLRDRKHKFFVLERKRHRVVRTLSDLNGWDPLIHGGTTPGIVSALLDCVDTRPGTPRALVEQAATALWDIARELKRKHRSDDVFTRAIFKELIAAGTELRKVASGT